MALAYIDTSCLVAIAFGEPHSAELAHKLEGCRQLLAANLLEAEFHAALVREGMEKNGDDLLSWVTWIFPDRPLSPELRRVTEHGYVRGADLWHLACALFLAGDNPSELIFATLDHRQTEVAMVLGFQSLEELESEVEQESGAEISETAPLADAKTQAKAADDNEG